METSGRGGLRAVPRMIRELLLGWLLAVTIETLCLPPSLRGLSGLEGIGAMSLPRLLAVTLGTASLLELLSRRAAKTPGSADPLRTVERVGILLLYVLEAALLLSGSFTWAFLGAVGLILVGLVFYVPEGWQREEPQRPAPAGKESPLWLWLTAGLAAAFFAFDCVWTVSRVRSFSTPSYDFGIFSQMFYYMRTTGLPLTTLERDGLLSHFRVHVSPIWYLMLPAYLVVPRPATLQVLQAAVLSFAVIPLWKLCRVHGLPGALRTLLCAALLLYPAYAGGTSYDVHENCFLTPLLLWLFCAADRERPRSAALAGMLTLLVKEDAAIYVAVIGLWLLLRGLLGDGESRRFRLGLGAALLGGAVLWFLLVTGWLARVGDGVMSYRYRNFMLGGSDSLVTVIRTVLLQPFKAVYKCVEPEKLSFLLLSFGVLLGLPLWTRRYERLVLLIPFLLINLMSDYRYQHDVFFQYSFGPTAFLFYLAAVNLAELRPRRAMAAAGAAAALCALCFGLVIVPKALTYPRYCQRYAQRYEQIRRELSAIPEGAPVTATTFYTTALSQRSILYDLRYASYEHVLETDYVVLSPADEGSCRQYASEGQEDGVEQLRRRLEADGYERISGEGQLLLLYHKSPEKES